MVTYNTKEECLKAIETVKVMGMDPQPWMLVQLEAFEKEEQKNAHAHNTDTPIWDTLKSNYPYGTMPEEKTFCIESTVEQLLSTDEHAEEPGLLLGKIQCGKTDTFEGIIGLAFDKGVDIAIVITKGTKALVNQTIKRMKNDYRWFKASDSLEQPVTIEIYDIMAISKTGLRPAIVESSKIVIVCKKQTANLTRLIDLFKHKSPFLKKKKAIIVDDEADFASRNYQSVKLKAESGDKETQLKGGLQMAKISQQIDDFRRVPDFCRYLQVTATPYCLYLQPDGELNLNGNIVKPFKPRFTSIVPTHSAYIGGHQYFVESADADSMYSHLYHQIDQKCIAVLGHEDKRYINNAISSGNIYGLTYALVAYFMATAVRRLQMKEEGKDYKTSAIIHVDIDKKNHDWQRRLVVKLIKSIESAILDEDRSDLRIWIAMENVYKDFLESNEKGRKSGLITVTVPTQDEILNEMRTIFSPKHSNYHVQPVNSDEDMVSILNEETGELKLECAANIFIGGNILDRGVTIKNMLCFFYGRNPKNFQQDTVLQHARMYGARSKEDMAVTRLHTTPQIYKILARMNELDEQLRQWFIEGKDKEGENAVFIGYDKNISPCAPQKIKVSNALLIKPQKTILPVGFWTKNKTATAAEMQRIRQLITTCPGYQYKDKDGFFEMNKETVVEILDLIESTYVYDDKFYNKDRKNDIKEILCVLEYCTEKSGGKVYALHREGRRMNRIRENGGYIDAPQDGRSDSKPSRAKAIDAPVIMLIQEKGEVYKDENGDNIGWNNAPFYWPVLMTQENISPAMFAMDQKNQEQKAAATDGNLLEDINPEEVLSITLKGDFETLFGGEGTEFQYDHCPHKKCVLKESTAFRYIQRESNGDWMLNPQVYVDQDHYHGVYSLNNRVFPFILKPYKYMCIRNRKDANSDVILLELFEPEKWIITPIGKPNEKGDLKDKETGDVLLHVKDRIINMNMEEHEFIDDSVTQWQITYAIKKVLKLKRYKIDWDTFFDDQE